MALSKDKAACSSGKLDAGGTCRFGWQPTSTKKSASTAQMRFHTSLRANHQTHIFQVPRLDRASNLPAALQHSQRISGTHRFHQVEGIIPNCKVTIYKSEHLMRVMLK